MKVIRQDDDLMLFEAIPGPDGRDHQLVALASVLVIPGILTWSAVRLGWWQQLDAATQLVGGFALAACVAGLLVVVCRAFPYVGALALDRSSRKGMCVWKTLCRSRSEEFDFDQVRQVEVEVQLVGGPGAWWMLRLTRCRGRSILIPVQAFRNAAGKAPAEALAEAMRSMLELNSAPEREARMSPAEERLTRGIAIVLGLLGISFGSILTPYAIERLQAGSWPSTLGTIESVHIQIGAPTTKHRYTVKGSYRYWVGGAEYHGTRFNLHDNVLYLSELDFVREHYHDGDRCQVWYQPGNPAQSFLTIDGATTWGVFEAGVSVLMILGGAILLVGNFWQMWRGRSGLEMLPPSIFGPASQWIGVPPQTVASR